MSEEERRQLEEGELDGLIAAFLGNFKIEDETDILMRPLARMHRGLWVTVGDKSVRIHAKSDGHLEVKIYNKGHEDELPLMALDTEYKDIE